MCVCVWVCFFTFCMLSLSALIWLIRLTRVRVTQQITGQSIHFRSVFVQGEVPLSDLQFRRAVKDASEDLDCDGPELQEKPPEAGQEQTKNCKLVDAG